MPKRTSPTRRPPEEGAECGERGAEEESDTLKGRVPSLPPAMRPIVSPVVLNLMASGLAARN